MKRLLLIVLLCTGPRFSQASPPSLPGQELPDFIYNSAPRGGGVKAMVTAFPLTLVTDPCNRGYRIDLVRFPGLVGNYMLEAREIYRGLCATEPRLDDHVIAYGSVEISRYQDGTVVYTAHKTLILADRRAAKADSQPGWVALVEGVLYQGTALAE